MPTCRPSPFSVSAALAALLTASVLWPPGARALEAVDLELVLAADSSGSIQQSELMMQREGYAAAITDPRVLDAIRGGYHQRIALAYVEWGGPDSQETVVDWTVIDGPESAEAFAQQLRVRPRGATSWNSISEAILYSVNEIDGNAYEGRRKIIDISGDGGQWNGRPLPLAKAAAMALDITINALVIYEPGGLNTGPMGEPLIDHYRNDVIGGRSAFAMVAEGRDEFAAAILKKMILEIAEAVKPD